MKIRFFEMGWVGVALGLAQMATACSSDPPSATLAQAGAGGVPSAGTGSRFGNTGGKLSSGGMAGGGGVAQASMCQKTSDIDAPDGEFTDANCDGIDGDKAKAIFVSPTGSDTATGAFGAPVKTITKGVALGLAAKKDVFVCQGEYQENLTLEGSVNLKVYGGYACADWKRTNQRPVVNPVSGVPLRVDNVTGEVLFDRMHFKAADATDPSGSSIAVWASSSRRLSMVQSVVEAGRGSAGLSGAAWDSLPLKAPSGASGNAPDSQKCLGGLLCQGGTSLGGTCVGGFGVSVQVRGGDGGDSDMCSGDTSFCSCLGQGNPSYEGQLGQPAATSDPLTTRDGRAGLPGAPGPDGAAASASLGTVDPRIGYRPTNRGAQGGFGWPGQSGEGGDSAQGALLACGWFLGPGGGQGGQGGCGGRGGLGGEPGGASLGVFSTESEVTLEFCNVITKDGGPGGLGGPGEAGELGGDGGLPGSAPAGKGGRGGNGGPGGPGGPGAGGPAIGILAWGIAPTFQQLTFSTGSGGLGGLARPESGSGDAVVGISADYWPVDIRPVVNGAAGAAGMAGKGGI